MKTEQFVAIGRMSVERCELRRQMASLKEKIAAFAASLRTAGQQLEKDWAYGHGPECFPRESYKGVLPIKDIEAYGGLGDISGAIKEYERLFLRVGDLSRQLADAGVE
jgi:hypothetical protein